jgi:hypothetical protein
MNFNARLEGIRIEGKLIIKTHRLNAGDLPKHCGIRSDYEGSNDRLEEL